MTSFALSCCELSCSRSETRRSRSLRNVSIAGTSDAARLVRSSRASDRNCKSSGRVARRSFLEVHRCPIQRGRLHLEPSQGVRFSSARLLVPCDEVGAVSPADRRIWLLLQVFHSQERLPHVFCRCWHDGAMISPVQVHKHQVPIQSLPWRRGISIVQSSTC